MQWESLRSMENELAQIEEDFMGGRLKVFGVNTDELLGQINDYHYSQINTSLQHISKEKFISEKAQHSSEMGPPPTDGGDPWTRTEAQVNAILDRGLSTTASSAAPGAGDTEFKMMSEDFSTNEANMNSIQESIKLLMSNVSRLNDQIVGLSTADEPVPPATVPSGTGSFFPPSDDFRPPFS